MSLHSSHDNDDLFLGRALELARAGIALTSPNPCVGCVIATDDGTVVGEAFHTYEGKKHAEILALERSGTRSRGASLYVNLEPCSHHGRTPPCADAVIAAGIRRVVCAMKDPNPQVSGAGIDKLRSGGVQVDVGLFEKEAKKLNESFAKYIRTGTPLVTLKAAMTLDGKIAPPPAGSRHPADVAAGGSTGGWITGEIARRHVHQLRHEHDAIMAGVGTVIADDPLLTDRSGLSRRRPLLRVLLDSWLRLPSDSRLVKTAHDDVLVLYSQADDSKKQELENLGIRVEHIPPAHPDGRPDLAEVLRYLGKREITSVLIEGGATVNWTALSSGVVDKLFLYYAPKILGEGAVPFAASGGASGSHAMLLAHRIELHQFGEDFAVEGYLRDPYLA